MKKIIALVLALIMALSLVACGGSAAPAATEAPKQEAAPAAPAAPAETDPVAQWGAAMKEKYGGTTINVLLAPTLLPTV